MIVAVVRIDVGGWMIEHIERFFEMSCSDAGTREDHSESSISGHAPS